MQVGLQARAGLHGPLFMAAHLKHAQPDSYPGREAWGGG